MGLAEVIPTPTSLCGGPFSSELLLVFSIYVKIWFWSSAEAMGNIDLFSGFVGKGFILFSSVLKSCLSGLGKVSFVMLCRVRFEVRSGSFEKAGFKLGFLFLCLVIVALMSSYEARFANFVFDPFIYVDSKHRYPLKLVAKRSRPAIIAKN